MIYIYLDSEALFGNFLGTVNVSFLISASSSLKDLFPLLDSINAVPSNFSNSTILSLKEMQLFYYIYFYCHKRQFRKISVFIICMYLDSEALFNNFFRKIVEFFFDAFLLSDIELLADSGVGVSNFTLSLKRNHS